ncbi:hypothetical protein J5U23_01873 [Saccharolobus shibatae B12]|uniref:Uncharacterized protein n=2 Tax=Saccharolobus shibatae TaxID=2286 RepID=A0A8F5BPJ2_SACSH|nr:hypothetical protein J5U23_01873 [Saccharolobus shibatae B12]QXJ32208.1 hypothetical protein J5U21_01859 [Saccharolobus shibatae]
MHNLTVFSQYYEVPIKKVKYSTIIMVKSMKFNVILKIEIESNNFSRDIMNK